MAARITATLLAAAAFAAAAQPAAAASPTRALASVAAIAGVPIRCYATSRAYFADARIPPTRYWLGIAGFWGVPRSAWNEPAPVPVIGLTAATCAVASRLREGVTVARAYAAFTVAHELAHALGTPDETAADCRGARLISEIAYGLGLRGHDAYAALLREARTSSGYARIPASCWAPVSS